jgi:hypothetical protein
MSKKKSDYVLALDTVEQKRYDEFQNKFQNKHYAKHKFRGGTPVTLTPTGIGVHVEVKCPKCLKTEDISNYDSW